MKKLRKFWNPDKQAYIYSLLFTGIIVIFLVAVLHIYPFGDHNLRYWDCDQYFAFYGYLQRSFLSKSNLLLFFLSPLSVLYIYIIQEALYSVFCSC